MLFIADKTQIYILLTKSLRKAVFFFRHLGKGIFYKSCYKIFIRCNRRFLSGDGDRASRLPALLRGRTGEGKCVDQRYILLRGR